MELDGMKDPGTIIKEAPAPDRKPAGMNYGKSFDDLLADLATPKQDFSPPPAKTAAPGSGMPGSIFDGPAPEPIAPEKAKRSGMRIAQATDGALSYVASIIAKAEEAKEYKADKEDINDLGEAFAEIAQEYNVDFPPWLVIVFLLISIYGPKFKQAFNDRRFNQMNERIFAMEEKYNKLLQDFSKLETKVEDKKAAA